MRKRLTLMLTALLAIATILCVVIYFNELNGTEPEPDYSTMDKAELNALVLVNPHWHEPRAWLAQLLLEEDNALAALEHMLILAWADWDVSDLRTGLIDLIQDKPFQAGDCLNLLAQQRQNWLWPREVLLQIATLTGQVDLILANLPPILKSNPEHPLAEAALAKYLSGDPLVAWEIARLMPDKLGAVVSSILQLPQEEQSRLVPDILAKHPKEPLVTVLAATQLGGETGLELLLALEDDGFQPWNADDYGEIKLKLLLQAQANPMEEEHLRNLSLANVIAVARGVQFLTESEQSYVLDLLLAMETLEQPPDAYQYSYIKSTLLQIVVPRQAHLREVTANYFLHLNSQHLFFVMEDWTEKLYWAGYDEYSLSQNIKMAAEVLVQDPRWAHIESILEPPNPPEAQAILPAEDRRDQGQINRVNLSPDGNQLSYITANTVWWYDLLEQQYRLAQSAANTEDLIVHWAPDSRSLALEMLAESGNFLQVQFHEPNSNPREIEVGQARILGWRDNSTLMLWSGSSPRNTVSTLDVDSGRIQAIGTFINQPVLTSTGKLAWAAIDGKSLTISIQYSETIFTLPQEGLSVSGWLPDDRGVLLQSGTKFYIADIVTAEITELDIPSFHPHAAGWRLDNKITGSFPLGLVNHVLILDIDTMKMAHTGIISYYGAFSGQNYYWHVYSGSIYIYKIH